MEQPPGPCHFVIFGATGSLVRDKLLPALYELEAMDRIPGDLRFVAFSRRDWNFAAWAEHMQLALQSYRGDTFDRVVHERLVGRFEYVRGSYDDHGAYEDLNAALARPSGGCGENVVFYLAIPPVDFYGVVTRLHEAGFSSGHTAHRIVVEKPFGEDLDSAQKLNRHLHKYFAEDQIYRIDHYLGKETVQNLLVFRFANTLIEPIWNRNYVDHVQILVAESAGIGSRAGFYDSAGALRDMLQNHMMQLLSVVAMEPPATIEADALRDEKVKVLRSIRPIPKRGVNNYAFRAQYAAGSVDGKPVVAYQDEDGVAENSTTETFVAAKFYIDNWRWHGVPFYLRTGKRLPEQLTMISIRFKHPPRQLFRETPVENIEPNWIVLAIQPHESMHIELHAKQPGLGMNTRTAKLIATYRQSNERSSDAYEALLLDVIEADRSLFIRFDEVEGAWRVVEPILQQWAQDTDFIHSYPAGSWGPGEAAGLFDSEDHVWRNRV